MTISLTDIEIQRVLDACNGYVEIMGEGEDTHEYDGQMSLNDWIADRDKVREVGIIGLCDDPICSNCGYEFRMIEDKRYHLKNEIDIDRCPKCKCKLDWSRWHRINEEE